MEPTQWHGWEGYELHNPNAYIILFVMSLLIGQALVFAPCFARFWKDFPRSLVMRFLLGLFLAQATYVGGSKAHSTLNYVAQFVTVLRNGYVIDESGVIAKATEQAVIDIFVDYARQITEAASDTVSRASVDFSDVAALVTNSNRRVIYISSYLPRSGNGQGAVTNHNIAATLEQTRMSDAGTNLVAWVWFSEVPAFAPGMTALIDVGGGPVSVPCTTNYYPAVELVNGVECVKYVFAIPTGARGVQFLPSYEVGFGTEAAPLVVPSAGITVKTNDVTFLPFDGTDHYFSGRLSMKYKGGIAIEAAISGSPITNGVYHL